jgi:protein-L-isoaspartate(D-aspartate) O-methyltransferase
MSRVYDIHTMSGSSMAADPVSLREALVQSLLRTGAIRSPEVAAAFRAVPRDCFLPGVALADVYRDDAIITRREPGGLPSSSSSQPSIMAIMIEQAGLRPGHRILEIGAGTGYNAAVLREVVGPAGRVVTVDIQPEVAQEAETHLRAAGHFDVVVATADGGFGYPAEAPYDCIMLTASASDISPYWRAQLRDGGLLVLPLRLRTQGLSVAFEKQGSLLASRSILCSGFMHLRGAFGRGDNVVDMGDGLFLSGPGARAVPLDLLSALLAERPRALGDLIVPVNSFGLGGGLGIYLALEEPGVIDIFTAHPERWGFHALSGVIDLGARSLALVRQDAVVVYGTDAAGEQMRRRAREWVALGRPGVEQLHIEAHPHGMAAELPGRWLIRGEWSDLVAWFGEA